MRRGRAVNAIGVFCLVALIGVFAIAGCGGSSKNRAAIAVNSTPPASASGSHSGQITIARSSDVTSLDPQLLGISEDYLTQEAIYGSLVRSSADGKSLEGGLASSWAYRPDALTYTFKLRPGLRFSDGSPITAQDIVYSITRAQQGPEYAPMLAAIKSVDVSKNQVTVRLTKYSNLVLPGLALAFILPNNLRGQKAADFFKHPVSSGEFTVSSWSPNSQMVLERNPHYVGIDHVYPKRVTFKIIPDENARLNALIAGDVQLDEYVPDEQASSLSPSQLVQSKPRATLVFLVTNNGKPPFDNVANREAATLAVNRQLILKTIWDGNAAGNQGLVPSGLTDSPEGQAWEYNPAKARQLLHGTHPSVTLLASYERGIDSSLVDALQQELQQVGFRVKVQVRDFASAVEQLLAGNFSAFLSPQSAFLPTAGEPMTTYTTLVAPVAHWDVKTAQTLLTRFSEAPSIGQRKATALAYERWAHSNWLANPVGNPYVFFGVNKNLRGLQIPPFGTYRLGSLQLAG